MGVFTSHELEFASWSLSTMRPGSLSTANRYERCDVTLTIGTISYCAISGLFA